MTHADLVWDEYKYRHVHIWSTVFKLTYSVAFLSAIPYLDLGLAEKLGFAILLPTFLAVVLALFGWLVTCRELQVFDRVKREHRRLHHYAGSGKDSRFTRFVNGYLFLLAATAVLNCIVICNWLPRLGPGELNWCPMDCP